MNVGTFLRYAEELRDAKAHEHREACSKAAAGRNGGRRGGGAGEQPLNPRNHVHKFLVACGLDKESDKEASVEVLVSVLEAKLSDEQLDPFAGIASWRENSKALALKSLDAMFAIPEVQEALFREQPERYSRLKELIDARRKQHQNPYQPMAQPTSPNRRVC